MSNATETVMRKITVAFLAVMLAGPAIATDTAGTKKRTSDDKQYSRSPSAIAERQRHKSTFDETQYFERLSEKIPFGSDAWWRQKQMEDANE
jgi:hypothetical protein